MTESSPVRVLHVTPRLSRLGGGVSHAIWGLVRATQPEGVRHTAVAVHDDWSRVDLQHAPAGCDVHTFEQKGLRSAFFSPSLGKYLSDAVGAHDIIHVHSIRHWPGFAARQHAVARGRPLLISLHGMLYPEQLRRSPVRKALIHRFVENETLGRAACLHATSEQELAAIRDFGCSNPVAVLPLGIDTDDGELLDSGADLIRARWPQLAGKRWLLYIGMLDAKKGLLRLTEAWARVQAHFPQWHLIIAGPDVRGFEAQLRATIRKLYLEARITLPGPMYGRDKHALFHASDLLVLPSDWENFGFVVGEALAAGLPVITTRRSPWQAVERHECGWWIDTSVDEIAVALGRAMALSRHELDILGARGKQLIRSQYSWRSIGQHMAAVYDWLAGSRPRPDCIDMGASHGREAPLFSRLQRI